MSSEIILHRLEVLSLEYKEVIFSEYPTQTANIYGEFLKLSETHITILGNGLTLFLLLFLDKYELIKFIITECKVAPTEADFVVDDILAELPPAMLRAQTEAYEKINGKVDDQAISEKTRISILKHTSNRSLELLRNLYSDELVNYLSTKYNFQELELDIKTVIGDIILGFYNIEDTVPLLQQELGLDAKTAALLGADVLDFLAPLSDPNFVIPAEDTEMVGRDTFEDGPAMNPAPASDNPVYTALQNQTLVPQAPQPLPMSYPVAAEVHTMATDAAVIRSRYRPIAAPDITPVHISEQPTFPRPLSDVPSYASAATPDFTQTTPTPIIEPPRWGN